MAMSCDTVIALTLLLLHVLYSDRTKCKKNEALDESYAINIYYCEDPNKYVSPSTNIILKLYHYCTKCKKDEALDESYPINIYYCEDPKKPECCQLEKKPTCCETKSEKSVKNQFELWGILGVVVVAVAFVVVCWRKDTYMCEGSTLKERCSNCCNCKKKKTIDDDEGAIELTISSKDKYRETTATARKPIRECTTVTARGVEPIFTSQHELHTSDVDSGRGSVTSSTPPANEMSPHNSKVASNNNSRFTGLGDGPSSSKAGEEEMVELADSNNTSSNSSKKKSKAKKKKKKHSKKSKKKVHDDSDSDIETVHV